MATGFYTWLNSGSASGNGTVDSRINYAEGQSPSSLNDSARMLMGELADFRDDISGGLTTAGTSTAYTVSTNQTFASLSVLNKKIVTIIPHTDSGASPTLAVDGLTAIAINYSTGVAVPSASLKSGTPYALIYLNATTEFIVLGALGALPPLSGPCPVGCVMNFAGTSAPTGWLLCYGQSLLRASYAALFAVIGTTFGSADGTHFTLPDCRGRAIAGKDDMGGVSADRLTNQSGGLNGDTLGATGGEETHVLVTGELAAHTHTSPALTDPGHTHTLNNATGQVFQGSGTFHYAATGGSDTGTATISANSASSGVSIAANTGSNGSGTAHNNVQPTIVLNKIIFAGV